MLKKEEAIVGNRIQFNETLTNVKGPIAFFEAIDIDTGEVTMTVHPNECFVVLEEFVDGPRGQYVKLKKVGESKYGHVAWNALRLNSFSID